MSRNISSADISTSDTRLVWNVPLRMKDTEKSLADGTKSASRSSSKTMTTSSPFIFTWSTSGALLSTRKSRVSALLRFAAPVLRRARRDFDDHRAVIVRIRGQVQFIARAIVRAAVVQEILGGAEDLDLPDRESGHRLGETDVDADFLVHGPREDVRKPDRGGNCRACRGSRGGGSDPLVPAIPRRLLSRRARRWNQERAETLRRPERNGRVRQADSGSSCHLRVR